MVRSLIVVAGCAVLLAAGSTMAGTPFGGDDTGFVPPAAAAKCEAGASKAISKFIGCVIKCHSARAAGKITNDAGEDACESVNAGKGCAEKYDASVGKLTGCPSCLNFTANRTLAAAVLDADNSATYCASPSGAFLN